MFLAACTGSTRESVSDDRHDVPGVCTLAVDGSRLHLSFVCFNSRTSSAQKFLDTAGGLRYTTPDKDPQALFLEYALGTLACHARHWIPVCAEGLEIRGPFCFGHRNTLLNRPKSGSRRRKIHLAHCNKR